MAIDPNGIPFFCEFGTNKIGKIDPRSFEITEYEVTPGARPRRLTITPDGKVYYSDFARGLLGRLDPATGEVREWESPSGMRSQPYGMTSTSDGVVWYSESGVDPNTIVRFDPGTESFQSWQIPSGGGVVRNMVATPDGRVYIACSGVNKVGIVIVNPESPSESGFARGSRLSLQHRQDD
jgi:virginiamycin B lyase